MEDTGEKGAKRGQDGGGRGVREGKVQSGPPMGWTGVWMARKRFDAAWCVPMPSA